MKVAIVEDHVLAAEGMRLAFTREGHDAEMWSPGELVGRLRASSAGRVSLGADVVLLDLDLGGGLDGTNLIGPITEARSAVVVCTAETAAERLGQCLLTGAAGVVGKNTTSADVIAAVVKAAAGEPVMCASRAADLIDAHHRHRCDEKRRLAPFQQLTYRESDVLGLIMDGVSAAGIAVSGGVSVKTVRHQIAAILQKLGVNSQLEAVAAAQRAGWTPPRPQP